MHDLLTICRKKVKRYEAPGGGGGGTVLHGACAAHHVREGAL